MEEMTSQNMPVQRLKVETCSGHVTHSGKILNIHGKKLDRLLLHGQPNVFPEKKKLK